MTSRCSTILRGSTLSAFRSAISKPASSSFNRSAATPLTRSSLPLHSVSSPLRRCSVSRSPVELGGVASMFIFMLMIDAIQAMVQQAMQYIDQTPDLDSDLELIKTLNNVSAGNIHVEIERARLIKNLTKIKKEQGLVAEAADLMQEVAVETFG